MRRYPAHREHSDAGLTCGISPSAGHVVRQVLERPPYHLVSWGIALDKAGERTVPAEAEEFSDGQGGTSARGPQR